MKGSAEQRERERRIFEGFLKLAPDFNARIAADGWTQPEDDPPDVMFRNTNGQRVGVELKAWINEDQMAEAKGREAQEARFLEAIAPQPKNACKLVAFVWLHRAGRRAPEGEAARDFKEELMSLVDEQDRQWSARRHEPVQGETVRDFGDRPSLKRYLAAISLFPRKVIDPREQDWIAFPLQARAYSEQDMLAPLQDLIAATRDKYATAKRDRGLDRLVLLIHYDGRAWQHNAPIETPDWDLDSFAREADFYMFALDTLSEEPSSWDEVFLYDAVRERSVRIYPPRAA